MQTPVSEGAKSFPRLPNGKERPKFDIFRRLRIGLPHKRQLALSAAFKAVNCFSTLFFQLLH
jgi:hypothetical protein